VKLSLLMPDFHRPRSPPLWRLLFLAWPIPAAPASGSYSIINLTPLPLPLLLTSLPLLSLSHRPMRQPARPSKTRRSVGAPLSSLVPKNLLLCSGWWSGVRCVFECVSVCMCLCMCVCVFVEKKGDPPSSLGANG